MDESTSRLEARAAAIAMRTVGNTMNTGRIVVFTTHHQPSIDILEAFDEVPSLYRNLKCIHSTTIYIIDIAKKITLFSASNIYETKWRRHICWRSILQTTRYITSIKNPR